MTERGVRRRMRYVGLGLREGTAEGIITESVSLPISERPGQVLATARLPPAAASHRWAAMITGGLRLGRESPASKGPPVVGGLPPDLFREGERVSLDGRLGIVEVPGLSETEVVTAFLVRTDGRLLLLRRSAQVGSFAGRWASVSGFLERAVPEAQARKEIQEEVGFGPDDVTLVRGGRVVYARDAERVFTIHPFRFQVRRTDPQLDWEHDAFEWVEPAELARRPTVPGLDRVWAAVLG